ncbi:RNase adaptor protein RapZ [Candidatus Desantisbacteria bacterium CG2_30_40_21]|uniref:RNase adapter RapZ n=5 Tax=unclassified Candidatus Desantisiibacteriota TaxID=3106372 RepID=A0A2M7JDH0_9BACT|nr:MAG: RNase adaptor protein RapZ [Candidatus Desantisbacteria bacterium CG2_30_40_21]PIP40236.1 MAG: RNase adapter RapZ [Candidatus Desantisbacteria bacterium CG23_combo_of_CG06-09_8_20_14_all_40_23]PIX17452.1 MAG: RNase adapter RapZ [Candidatus Desantisbacteria bacterium CG_4_8_14_3_um_filter_40_12]PIY18848.1 MAG: RNase adapter RapZ [Candidatus Desantisbacteria bacterium CG_4_10_14_3_um_filter_40_18]PJB29969.1 MAG: RNase adapter RapZ [Candidatus Desantisbacteria bacterium CG_4_9_14_3_um_filt
MKKTKKDKSIVKFIIVSGLSGAGKSQALKCFEDMGFFCVDNLPTTLIPKFAELCAQSMGMMNNVALGIDVREADFFKQLFETLLILSENNIEYRVVFLEASNNVLIKRYSETRRPHPLSTKGKTVLDDIIDERKKIESLKERADLVVDTSFLTVHELRNTLWERFNCLTKERELTISLVSFGYKYGIPSDADLLFDLRFLPNPNYIEELNQLTGDDKGVVDYILKFPMAHKFLEKLFDLIGFLIPQYIAEGKSYLTIGFGCTGGRHRSVALCNLFADFIKQSSFKVNLIIKHRDSKK